MKNFNDVKARLKEMEPINVVVAQAGDEEVLKALSIAAEEGYAKGILVGDQEVIKPLIQGTILEDARVVHATSDEEAAALAVKEVREGRGDLLMKGLVNTSIFMRAVLNREHGLRKAPLLSLMAVYELPFYHKLLFISDSGINVAPDEKQKAMILSNALEAMEKMGVTSPKVGILTANEAVDPKVQSTTDAAYLVDQWKSGRWPQAIVEGPIAFDVLFSQEAAEHKGIASQIAGDADLIIMPNIETGNALAKSWLLFNDARWSGMVLGAQKPILIGSRSDSAEIKALSLAVAALAAGE